MTEHEPVEIADLDDVLEIDDAAGRAAPPAPPAPPPAWLGSSATALALWRLRWGFAVVAWGVAALLVFVTGAGDHMDPYLSITGLLVGFLVGLTGMGGGALMTPILIFVFDFKPSLAIGTDIAYAAITKVFGSWRHWKNGSVDLPLSLWLALGSIPSGLLGAWSVNFIKNNYGDVVDDILYRAIGSALMLVAVLLVVRLVMKVDKSYPAENIHMSTARKIATVAIGASTGFIIGLTSVGSGTLLAMFLIVFYPLATSRIVGTDVFHATLLLGVTGLAQIRFGNVDLWMVASLLIGSVPGVIVGSHLTVRAPTKVLRGCLAVVLFLSGLAMLGKA